MNVEFKSEQNDGSLYKQREEMPIGSIDTEPLDQQQHTGHFKQSEETIHNSIENITNNVEIKTEQDNGEQQVQTGKEITNALDVMQPTYQSKGESEHREKSLCTTNIGYVVLKIEQNDENQLERMEDKTTSAACDGPCFELPNKQNKNNGELDGQRENSVMQNMSNIMYAGPPTDDCYLYCEECKTEHKGDCPIHGPLIVIQNTKVEEKDPDRALHSLPPNLLVKESSIDGAGLGVFTDIEISPGTTYGPYEGMEITDPELAHSSGYCWQIYKDGLVSHFIDAKDTACSNWMRYINCALSDADQNLVAFQYKREIYYRCIKAILPKSELLVWYGDDCAKTMNISKERPHLSNLANEKDMQIKKAQEGTPFQCEVCCKIFDKRFKLNIHLKAHQAKNIINQGWKLDKCELRDRSFVKCSRTKKQIRVQLSGQNSHKCDVCDKGFSGISKLIIHKRKHTGDRPYKCDVCNQGFSYSSTLTRHKQIHTGERPYKCYECGKAYSDITNLTIHKWTHTSEKPYKCDVCFKSFSEKSKLTRHKRIHILIKKPYKCDVCNRSYSVISALNRHKTTHTGEKPYKCVVCNMAFLYRVNLTRHNRIHAREKAYKCDVCGKGFSKSSSLTAHRQVHREKKSYKCDVCNKIFSDSSAFNRHKRIHTGEKPYKCGVCSKTFSEKSTLNRHSMIHTGEKPYKCDVCGKAFSHLSVHKRIHTGEKPYKCDVCNKGFSNSSSLSRHKRIHTGEKPYICDVCGGVFSDCSNLTAHKRKHTGEKPYRCDMCNKAYSERSKLTRHKRSHT